jgi:hypothetical protein
MDGVFATVLVLYARSGVAGVMGYAYGGQ